MTATILQLAALEAMAAAEARGVRRELLALPTGTGKTVVFAELIWRTASEARAARRGVEDALGPDVRGWGWSLGVPRLINLWIVLAERGA